MHHFVGYAEDGSALYKDGCNDDVCVLEAFVGQVIDLSPPAEDDDHVSDLRDMVIARVGAVLSPPQAPHDAPRAQARRAPLLSSTAPHYPVQSPNETPAQAGSAAQVPYWACFGRAEGGYYANNPTPGATFEQDAFTREAVQPGEEIAQDYYNPPFTPYNPIDYATEAMPRSGILRNIVSGAHRFLTGQWAHGNPAPLKQRGHYNTRQGDAKRKASQNTPTSGRAASCAAHKAYQDALGDVTCIAQGADPSQYSQQAGQAAQNIQQASYGSDGGGGGGGGGRGYCGGYCGEDEGCYAEEGPQRIPPGYCFVPFQPDEQGGEDCEGGDCCDVEGATYAGQAPAGLGSEIGGLAGGLLGMFIGAPELGAPIGAAMGGAIQGAACQHHAPAGFGMQAQQGPSMVTKGYVTNGARVQIHGSVAPDGLFEPAQGEAGPMVAVIQQANDILRKNAGPGAHFNAGPAAGSGTRARVGQDVAEEARQIFDDSPRFAAAGFWDEVDALQDNLSRHVEDAADWVYDTLAPCSADQGDAALKYVVSGGPGAKDFGPYSAGTIQSVLQGLRNAGYDVDGSNPYDVDVKQHGVKLSATVHPNGTVTIAIAASNFYVTHDAVWEKVDPLMPAAG